MLPAEPYLSIVATTRNDDHGGSLLRRTQTFVNALVAQCNRHELPGGADPGGVEPPGRPAAAAGGSRPARGLRVLSGPLHRSQAG